MVRLVTGLEAFLSGSLGCWLGCGPRTRLVVALPRSPRGFAWLPVTVAHWVGLLRPQLTLPWLSRHGGRVHLGGGELL